MLACEVFTRLRARTSGRLTRPFPSSFSLFLSSNKQNTSVGVDRCMRTYAHVHLGCTCTRSRRTPKTRILDKNRQIPPISSMKIPRRSIEFARDLKSNAFRKFVCVLLMNSSTMKYWVVYFSLFSVLLRSKMKEQIKRQMRFKSPREEYILSQKQLIFLYVTDHGKSYNWPKNILTLNIATEQ